MQDEEHLHRALEHRVRLVLQLGHPEQHAEEVAGIAEVVVRLVERPADRVAERVGGDARDLGDEPDRLQPPRFRREDFLGLGIEGRQRADGADEHAHRVGVVPEPFHQLRDVGVQHRVHA